MMPSLLLTSLILLITYVVAHVQYSGINIPGFDFGLDTSGIYNPNPTGQNFINSGAAASKITHFVSLGLKTFRLPVAWQFLAQANNPGALNIKNWHLYDGLVQTCLSAGASLCVIDLHNYARWNGAANIIGPGGPTNTQLATFWSQLAAKYAGDRRVAFDLMNEPHDLDINGLALTYQAVVAAIRKVGGPTSLILIEGTDYASAGAFPYNSGNILLNVTNPDGSTSNLIFSVHQYLDANLSGTQSTCPNSAVEIFQNLGDWLRDHGRQAFVGEIGGGTGRDCASQICAVLDVLNEYADVFIGVTTWAAGAFQTSYPLSEVPTWNGYSWVDVPIVSDCMVPKLAY
jgi:endoglucanase